jgi:phosphoribosyl-AMP cyclohydrolase
METYFNTFDFAGKQLFIDCDEDCFLEIDPNLNIQTVESNRTLVWKDGKNLIPQKEFETLTTNFPPLCPFVAQDLTGKELMVAWGKKESFDSALLSGFGTYFSRSRNGKWVKGEESGHLQNLKEVYIYRFPFFIQYKTDQIGAACHTGYYSCFFRELKANSNISFVYTHKVGEQS